MKPEESGGKPKHIPSGKQHSYGKSLVLMGKSTINGHFQ